MAPFSSKLFTVCISFLWFVKIGFGQAPCGTQISEETAEYLATQLDDVNQFIEKNATLKNAVNYKFPIQIHIVRQANGTGGMTAAQANKSIVDLNADFADAGVEFIDCAAINYINSDDYYNFEQAQEETITDLYNVEGAINLYYFNRVKYDFNGTLSDICGYAYLPLGFDHLMLRNSCILSSNTLSHEMGHYFGLLHTHDTRYGAEAITRDVNDSCYNCDTTGDQLCDTDADPNLNLLVDINCNYTGTASEPCSGGQYTPQTDNTMAYSSGACSSVFTPQQNSRISYYAFQRSYTGCISASCPVPSNLSESNITGASATLSWTTPAGAGISEVRYRISGSNWNFGGEVESPLTLNGLSQGYIYEYSIRTRCSDMQVSKWVTDGFNAIPGSGGGCSAPNSWGGSSQGTTAYRLVWGAASGATSYAIRHRRKGTNDAWTTKQVNATNTLLNNLDAGTQYEFQMATVCGNDNSEFTGSAYFTTLGDACVDVQLTIFLEGALADLNSGGYLKSMRTNLNTDLGMLPGQTPVSTIAPATPAGQPYAVAPWLYAGTEGANWTDSDYIDIATEYGVKVVDWVLLTFRTTIMAASNFKKTAALLMEDGTIVFPQGCPLTAADPTSFYVLVEHRNHIGALTATPVTVVNRVAAYDFTIANSYGGNGQKEVESGVWALFAGEGEQSNLQGYDVNGDDKATWSGENGNFGIYDAGDYNMNGDINGADKNYWSLNNGISSSLSR